MRTITGEPIPLTINGKPLEDIILRITGKSMEHWDELWSARRTALIFSDREEIAFCRGILRDNLLQGFGDVLASPFSPVASNLWTRRYGAEDDDFEYRPASRMAGGVDVPVSVCYLNSKKWKTL